MTDLQPGDIQRSGKRTLMLLGTHRKTQIWRDVTLLVEANTEYPHSKYMPHQGKRECARRVRQAERARAKCLAARAWLNGWPS